MSSTRCAIHDARWIWAHGDTERENQHGLFRREFILPNDHGVVRVHACADMRYWLYVNGKRVGFGPGRFPPTSPQRHA